MSLWNPIDYCLRLPKWVFIVLSIQLLLIFLHHDRILEHLDIATNGTALMVLMVLW